MRSFTFTNILFSSWWKSESEYAIIYLSNLNLPYVGNASEGADPMEFNVKLQELRKQKGLTQTELSEILFVSRTAISKWESGGSLR